MNTYRGNSRASESRTSKHPGAHDALVRILLTCLQRIDQGTCSLQPFSGYWIDPNLAKPDMDITVMLFVALIQEVYLGSLDPDEYGREIWVDQYGLELERVQLWVELPYPGCSNGPAAVGECLRR